MYRIASCRGTTTVANENIIPLCLAVTPEIKRVGLGARTPFILRKIVFYSDVDTIVYINTSDTDMNDGLNQTFLRETFAGSGEYSIALNVQDVLITKFVIADAGTNFEITFLY